MSFWSSTIFGTKPDFSFDNYARVIITDLYRDQLFKTLRIGVSSVLSETETRAFLIFCFMTKYFF